MRGYGRILAGILLFFTAALSTAAADTGGTDGESQYEQAMQFRSQGQMAEAEQAFLKAIQEEPNNPDYHFELANLYVSLYDGWQGSAKSPRALTILGRAEREFEQALTFRPDYLPARFNLGVVYKCEGQYEKAREAFRGVLERSPQQAAAWYQIASTYQEQGFWEDAQDAYMKARDLGYDPSQIQDALEDMQKAQTRRQQRSSSPLGNMGAFGGSNRSGFMNDPYSNQQTDPYGRQANSFFNNGNSSNNGYGNTYGNNGYDSGNNSSNGGQTSVSSMAAMLLQQVLSQRSQNNNQN